MRWWNLVVYNFNNLLGSKCLSNFDITISYFFSSPTASYLKVFATFIHSGPWSTSTYLSLSHRQSLSLWLLSCITRTAPSTHANTVRYFVLVAAQSFLVVGIRLPFWFLGARCFGGSFFKHSYIPVFWSCALSTSVIIFLGILSHCRRHVMSLTIDWLRN